MCIPYWQALLNTSDWGMANMQWNLGWEKMNFWSGLNTGFMNASGAMDWITNPQVALWQASQANNGWNFNNSGSIFPSWQNIGNGWNMSPMNPWGNMGWTPSGNADGGNSGKTETTAQKEIKKVKSVYDAVKKIVKKDENFIDNDILVAFEKASSDYKEETDENGKTKKVKKTDEEKLADMKEAMKAFGSQRLRIALLEECGYRTKLVEAGFDFKASDNTLGTEDSSLISELDAMYTDVKSGNYVKLNTVVGAMKSDDVLQYISQWNEKYKTDKDRSIIRLVANNMPSNPGANGREGFKEAINKLTDNLCAKASDYESYEGVAKLKKELGDKQAELNKAFADTKTTSSTLKAKMNDVATAFEALYAKVRMQEAAAISKEIKDKYAETMNSIVEGTIPNDIIVDETKADLTSEGLKAPAADEIKEPKYKQNVSDNNEEEPEVKTWNQDVSSTTENNIQKLIDSGVLEETDSTDPKVYYSSEYKRYYTIKGGKLYRLNNNVKEVTKNGFVKLKDGKEVSVKSAISNQQAIIDAMVRKADDSKTTASAIANEEDGAYDLGYEVAQDLIGYTNSEELTNVKNSLAAINKNNVQSFLDGYYANDGGGNGLFLQLALETTKLKNSDVVPVMRAIVDAVPDDLRNTKQFRTLQRICRMYERKDGNSDFKMSHGDLGWGWNRIWGIDDLDQFDDAVEALFQLKDSADEIEEKNNTKTEDETSSGAEAS